MNRQNVFWILLTSVGLIVTFPPFPTGLMAVVVLVPFFFYLRDKSPWEAFRGGYAIGVLWAGGTIYWIGWATVSGFLGALLFVPLYSALFAIVQSWLWNRFGSASFWAAPFLWTGIELLSSWGILGFPWNSLAHTQTYFPILIQYASLTGMYGVTFWVVMLNVLFFFLVEREGRRKQLPVFILGIGLLFIIPLAYGRWVLSRPHDPETQLRVSLVQGNIDPYKKWTSSFVDSNFVVYRRLTWQAGDQNPDLVVWPETAAPCYLRHRFSYLNQVKSQFDSLGIPLLTGSPDYEWIERDKVKKYNGALFIHPNSWRIEWYYKMHLVPFSERVPLVDRMPFLYDILSKMDSSIGDFSPGDSTKVFEFELTSTRKKVPFSVVICYESIFPYLVRKFVKEGAQFLVVITNDGWFGKTSGPYQHAQFAVLRAIENRVWIARCANTGISGFIDPFGRIVARTSLNEEAVLTGLISVGNERTFFVTHGSLFPFLVVVMNSFIFIFAFLGKGGQRFRSLKREHRNRK